MTDGGIDDLLMAYFRKRLTPEVLGEINEMILRDATERQAKGPNKKGPMVSFWRLGYGGIQNPKGISN